MLRGTQLLPPSFVSIRVCVVPSRNPAHPNQEHATTYTPASCCTLGKLSCLYLSAECVETSTRGITVDGKLWSHMWKRAAFPEDQNEAPTTGVALTWSGDLVNNSISSDEDLVGLIKARRIKEALLILDARDQQGVSVSCEVYASLLRGCIGMKALAEGEQVHAHIMRAGVKMSVYLQNTLISMYVKLGKAEQGLKVFHAMETRTAVSWNTLIAGYAKTEQADKAFELFEQMQVAGEVPNRITYISILKAFATPEWLEKGVMVHHMIVACGLESDLDVINSLLEMYVKCGSTEVASELFQKLPHPNEVSWNLLIAGHVRKGQLGKAVDLLERAGQHELKSKVNIYINILSSCTGPADLQHGKKVHDDLIKSGLQLDGVVGNCLIDMYGKCGSMQDALNVFRKISKRDAFTWTSLIAGYVRHGQNEEAMKLFMQIEQDDVHPTQVTFATVLKACCSLGALEHGKYIHAQITDYGYETNAFLMSSLVEMYTKCGSIDLARQLFDRIAGSGPVAWNMMLAGYAEHGLSEEAWDLFEQMTLGRIKPDSVTFASVLSCCSTPSHLERGKLVHSLVLENGLAKDIFVGNSLVNMYIKCDSLLDARKVFDSLSKKNLVSWNTMLGGYAKHGLAGEAVELYNRMISDGELPDQLTFSCILKACDSSSALKLGQLAHSEIESHGMDLEGGLGDSLIDMYVRCGSLQDARQVFDQLRVRGDFVWTLLIQEYAKHGAQEESIRLFKKMRLEGMIPMPRTFVSILSACNRPELLGEGRQVHDIIIQYGYESDIFVSNALLAMYANCGGIQAARQYFDAASAKDVVTWNSMIKEYVKHGHVSEAFQLFALMESQGAMWDKVTVCTLLHACSGPADKERGKRLHNLVRERGLHLDVFVENTLLDMYVNCGDTHDAEEVFYHMGEQNLVTWNTMLGGYVKHGEEDKARELFMRMQLEGLRPDKVSYLWILQACTSPEALAIGRKVHLDLEKQGLLSDIMVGTAVVDMYAKCGSLVDAREVFENMPEQDVILWNCMIGGYSENGDIKEAFKTFEEMLEEGWSPDRWTFVNLLLGCSSPASLEDGKRIHNLALQRGYKSDVFVGSALVCMYSRCGSLEDAIAVFESITDRDVVLWTAMIVVYAKHGYDREAFAIFWQMDETGIKPDIFLYVGMLNLCANTVAVEDGKKIHGRVVQDGLQCDVFVGTALIDMYARCGLMDEAREVFNMMSKGDQESWRVLVAGYTELGQTENLGISKLLSQN